MGHPITLIRGESIGSEVMAAAQLVIEAAGVPIDWQIVEVDAEAAEKYGVSLPERLLDSIQGTKVALKAPLVASATGYEPWINAALRKHLNLYASLRPVRVIPGVDSAHPQLDVVIVRETTEGLYAGIEFERTSVEAAEVRDFLSQMSGVPIRADAAVGIKSISVLGSRRVVDFACRHAMVTGRQKVTVVHEAQSLPQTDGLFLAIAREVAKAYPKLEFADCRIDALYGQLFRSPEQFDLLVLPNLSGDTVSNLCAEMAGGMGVVPHVSIGDDYAVFEAASGGSPDAVHNPTALILAAVLMLQHLGEIEAAARIQAAVEAVIGAQKSVTADLVSAGTEPVSTRQMAEAIAEAIA